MTPSLTDYLRGLRRLWWIPILALLIGGAIGVYGASSKPPVTTVNLVLFTFKPSISGQNSACPPGSTQRDVDTDRLNAYVQIVMDGQAMRDLLVQRGLGTAQTTGQLTVVATPGGVVGITLNNGDLSLDDGVSLTKSIANGVATGIIKIDSSQAAPILEPNTVVTTTRTATGSPSMLKLGLPIAVLFAIALAAVYAIVWAQGRIWTGRAIEDRIGARLIGEASDHAADGLALALAFTKGRDASTRALLIPIGTTTEDAVSTLGQVIDDAWGALKHPVTRSSVDEIAAQSTPTAGDPGADLLDVVVAANGLDADALQAAPSADIIALVIRYGDARYQDLTSAGRMLARVTDAEIAVIGLAKRTR